MKKFGIFLWLVLALTINCAHAQHMVKEENYLKNKLECTGLPDYPPFSYYIEPKKSTDIYQFRSAFLQPTIDIMKKYGFAIIPYLYMGNVNFNQIILDIRSGETQLFFGAYSNTKMFNGIDLLYPASISNPIHVITLPNTQDKIKSSKDLANLKGAVSKTEYLSDYVLRKIKPLNLAYLESPYEAYEKLFTGEIDYLLGGLYYNKIMGSRYGIEQYLAFSTKPLLKIPVFMALSKITPLHSQYKKAFEKEIADPKFATAVKKEILRIVEEEITQNSGIVPPAFAQKVIEEEIVEAPVVEQPEDLGGKVIEKEIKVKTIDEVLEGI